MIIVGVDYHPSVQQVAFLDTETGETGERRLNHSDGEAERFYRDLQRRQVRVRAGMEATGHARWFERLLAKLNYELWIGDPARIKAARVRRQMTDRQEVSIKSLDLLCGHRKSESRRPERVTPNQILLLGPNSCPTFVQPLPF